MKIFFILSLSLLALQQLFYSVGARAEIPSIHGPIKVLELNFNSGEVPNNSNYFVRDLRFNALVAWVRANDPDVIFLEEAWSYRNDHSVAFSLARALGYDYAYRLEMGFPDFFYEADAVLAKKESL